MKVKFYQSSNAKTPVLEAINDLSNEDQTKILGCLENIQQLGFHSPRVEFRQIDGKLWEIKIKVRSGGYRIFYVSISKETMVLLHMYKKQGQKAPAKEIKTAMSRLKEVIDNEADYIG